MDGMELTYPFSLITEDPLDVSTVRHRRTRHSDVTEKLSLDNDLVFGLVFDQFHSRERWHV